MAPHRGSSKPARGGRSNGGGTRKPSGISKSRVAKKATSKLPPPKQQKTKAASSTIKHGVGKKKKRVYTEKELGIPKLNMITPLGVEAPKGKKRGKVFVDDAESMMTILAIVNADKEGQIESKMQKSRHLEEIRAARKLEAEKREQARKGKLEETKDSLRKSRKPRSGDLTESSSKSNLERDMHTSRPKKRVSFG